MKYENWLAGMRGLSGQKKILLAEYCGSARQVYGLRQDQLKALKFLTPREQEEFRQHQRNWELEQEEAYLMQNGIKLISYGTEAYPQSLVHIHNPPYGLYCRGSLPGHGPLAAVVGARTCSEYGRKTAEQIGYCLARAGIGLISGMASGIDGAGHRGAMQAGGRTYGVLGCGVDMCYPAGNRDIYEALPGHGAVISEYARGTNPLPAHFPQRNRIISGLADWVIVVEAREKSGSLITADLALDQGKDVYAVPGRVGDALSRGTNRLIAQGAGIFQGTEEFLEECGIFAETFRDAGKKQKNVLDKSEQLVYSCVDLSPRNLEELRIKTKLSLAKLIPALTKLQEKGYLSEVYKNYFIRSESDA